MIICPSTQTVKTLDPTVEYVFQLEAVEMV